MRATASCMIPAVSRSLFALISALLMFHCVSVAPTCASFLREQQQQPTTTTTTTTDNLTTARTTTTTSSVGAVTSAQGGLPKSFEEVSDFSFFSINENNDDEDEESNIYFTRFDSDLLTTAKGDTVVVSTTATEIDDAAVDNEERAAEAAAEAASSAEQDDPRFDWDTSLPNAATSCFFTGLPVRADNGVILRFSGAAVRMADANYPFRALHECGVITDSSECGDYVLSDTDSTKPCTWQTNSQALGAKYGTASCSSVSTTALELEVGMSTWFNALERYEANGYLNVSDEQIFMREEELADCLQYTAEGPDVCNSKTDSRGHQCTMCEKIPYDYYPFLEAPMDPDDSNYIRLCLADYTFPTFCNMFKQITTMCSSGEYWEPTYNTTSTTTTVSPDATTITTTTTTTSTVGSDTSTTTSQEDSDATASSSTTTTTTRSTVTLSRDAGKSVVSDARLLLLGMPVVLMAFL